MKSFADPAVAAVFEAYPAAMRRRLLALRALVFDVAAKTEGVGRLTETLKWGQPSYLTEQTKSGTTVRIDRLKNADGYALYAVHHDWSSGQAQHELRVWELVGIDSTVELAPPRGRSRSAGRGPRA